MDAGREQCACAAVPDDVSTPTAQLPAPGPASPPGAGRKRPRDADAVEQAAAHARPRLASIFTLATRPRLRRILCMRHAHVASYSSCDASISRQGRMQASQLHAALRSRVDAAGEGDHVHTSSDDGAGVPCPACVHTLQRYRINAVVCSPLTRALQTLARVCGASHAPATSPATAAAAATALPSQASNEREPHTIFLPWQGVSAPLHVCTHARERVLTAGDVPSPLPTLLSSCVCARECAPPLPVGCVFAQTLERDLHPLSDSWPGGVHKTESADAFRARVHALRSFLRHLPCSDGPEDAILLVAHANLLRALMDGSSSTPHMSNCEVRVHLLRL